MYVSTQPSITTTTTESLMTMTDLLPMAGAGARSGDQEQQRPFEDPLDFVLITAFVCFFSILYYLIKMVRPLREWVNARVTFPQKLFIELLVYFVAVTVALYYVIFWPTNLGDVFKDFVISLGITVNVILFLHLTMLMVSRCQRQNPSVSSNQIEVSMMPRCLVQETTVEVPIPSYDEAINPSGDNKTIVVPPPPTYEEAMTNFAELIQIRGTNGSIDPARKNTSTAEEATQTA